MARSIKEIKTRDTFYILTNGKETEYNYFDLLKSKKSIYNVKVIYFHKDPYALIEQAKTYLSNANQVWAVFDIDNTYEENRLIPALKLASQNGIKYAYSNLAFEVWLIMHFKECFKEMDTKEHKRVLDKYLSEKQAGLSYNKSDKEILKKYFIPYYKTAMQNAKINYQSRVAEHNRYSENTQMKIWEWNSSTNVYKLIEALKLIY